jgi:hypothetical protein
MRNREGKETYLALQLAIYITYLNLSYLDLLFAKYGYNLHLDRLPNLLNYLLSILLSYGFACAFLQCNHFLEL